MGQTQLGAAAEEMMYVYACPLEHHRYWWPEDITDEYASLPCEVCGASCEIVATFGYVPWDWEATMTAAVEGDPSL